MEDHVIWFIQLEYFNILKEYFNLILPETLWKMIQAKVSNKWKVWIELFAEWNKNTTIEINW